MSKITSLLVLCLGCHAYAAVAQIGFVAGTDITAAITQAVVDGQNGSGPNQAVIILPAGVFFLSRSVNLHQSTLKGVGINQTYLVFMNDLGTGAVGITGDASTGPGPFEIDDLTVSGPQSPAPQIMGTAPNLMDGVHLYSSCVLRRVGLEFFHEGALIEGGTHILDSVCATNDLDGLCFLNMVSGSDDGIVNSELTGNTRSGLRIADGASVDNMSIVASTLGLQPIGILLGNESVLTESSFLGAAFQNVGNGDICDTNSTSAVTANFFEGVQYWGTTSRSIMRGYLAAPSLRTGTFASNTIICPLGFGPCPGNLFAASGILSNTWISDPPTLAAIVAGQISPLTAQIGSSNYGNVMSAGLDSVLPMVADL